MTEKWYPIINEKMCRECGECIAFCKRGVYDKIKGNKPVVIYPDGCVDQCRNCGKLCPTGSITYMNDDTGWTPPNAKADQNCCSNAKTGQNCC